MSAKASKKGKKRKVSAAGIDAEKCEDIRSGLFAEADAHKKTYAKAKPFTHVMLPEIGSNDLMQEVQKEAIENLKATFKETDLFKVYQVPQDLSTLETAAPEVAANCPALLRLRNQLYSKKFRSYLQDVTGCGPLSDRIDCSVNVYDTGGYLLCHDDVIGTRRLSYIVYLVDEAWNEEEDGGGLALYPHCTKTRMPEPEPTAVVTPKWNHMVLFQVRPGASFHSVEEVRGIRPRMSISGWYHARKEDFPKGYWEQASLNQIKDQKVAQALCKPFVSKAPNGAKDKKAWDDLEAKLREWVNPLYFDKKEAKKIADKFSDESILDLRDFLHPTKAKRITKAVRSAKPDTTTSPVGPAHLRRYIEYNEPSDAVAALLLEAKEAVFENPFFYQKFLPTLTRLSPISLRSSCRRFRRGQDYQVAAALEDEHELLPLLDLTLTFVGGAEDAWEGGEHGGFMVYMQEAVDDDPEVAATYDAAEDEGGGFVLNQTPSDNSLCMVMRDQGVLRFVKYLASTAPTDRFDISVEYCLSEQDRKAHADALAKAEAGEASESDEEEEEEGDCSEDE